MKLSERVHLIASGQAGCALSHPADCNAYALQAESGRWLLIDTGCGQESSRLVAELQRDGVEPSACAAILVTHGHLDHSGGAAWLSQQLGAPVWAGALTASWLRAGNEAAIGLAAAKSAGVYGAEFHLEPCPIVHEL